MNFRQFQKLTVQLNYNQLSKTLNKTSSSRNQSNPFKDEKKQEDIDAQIERLLSGAKDTKWQLANMRSKSVPASATPSVQTYAPICPSNSFQVPSHRPMSKGKRDLKIKKHSLIESKEKPGSRAILRRVCRSVGTSKRNEASSKLSNKSPNVSPATDRKNARTESGKDDMDDSMSTLKFTRFITGVADPIKVSPRIDTSLKPSIAVASTTPTNPSKGEDAFKKAPNSAICKSLIKLSADKIIKEQTRTFASSKDDEDGGGGKKNKKGEGVDGQPGTPKKSVLQEEFAMPYYYRKVCTQREDDNPSGRCLKYEYRKEIVIYPGSKIEKKLPPAEQTTQQEVKAKEHKGHADCVKELVTLQNSDPEAKKTPAGKKRASDMSKNSADLDAIKESLRSSLMHMKEEENKKLAKAKRNTSSRDNFKNSFEQPSSKVEEATKAAAGVDKVPKTREHKTLKSRSKTINPYEFLEFENELMMAEQFDEPACKARLDIALRSNRPFSAQIEQQATSKLSSVSLTGIEANIRRDLTKAMHQKVKLPTSKLEFSANMDCPKPIIKIKSSPRFSNKENPNIKQFAARFEKEVKHLVKTQSKINAPKPKSATPLRTPKRSADDTITELFNRSKPSFEKRESKDHIELRRLNPKQNLLATRLTDKVSLEEKKNKQYHIPKHLEPPEIIEIFRPKPAPKFRKTDADLPKPKSDETVFPKKKPTTAKESSKQEIKVMLLKKPKTATDLMSSKPNLLCERLRGTPSILKERTKTVAKAPLTLDGMTDMMTLPRPESRRSLLAPKLVSPKVPLEMFTSEPNNQENPGKQGGTDNSPSKISLSAKKSMERIDPNSGKNKKAEQIQIKLQQSIYIPQMVIAQKENKKSISTPRLKCTSKSDEKVKTATGVEKRSSTTKLASVNKSDDKIPQKAHESVTKASEKFSSSEEQESKNNFATPKLQALSKLTKKMKMELGEIQKSKETTKPNKSKEDAKLEAAAKISETKLAEKAKKSVVGEHKPTGNQPRGVFGKCVTTLPDFAKKILANTESAKEATVVKPKKSSDTISPKVVMTASIPAEQTPKSQQKSTKTAEITDSGKDKQDLNKKTISVEKVQLETKTEAEAQLKMPKTTEKRNSGKDGTKMPSSVDKQDLNKKTISADKVHLESKIEAEAQLKMSKTTEKKNSGRDGTKMPSNVDEQDLNKKTISVEKVQLESKTEAEAQFKMPKTTGKKISDYMVSQKKTGTQPTQKSDVIKVSTVTPTAGEPTSNPAKSTQANKVQQLAQKFDKSVTKISTNVDEVGVKSAQKNVKEAEAKVKAAPKILLPTKKLIEISKSDFENAIITKESIVATKPCLLGPRLMHTYPNISNSILPGLTEHEMILRLFPDLHQSCPRASVVSGISNLQCDPQIPLQRNKLRKPIKISPQKTPANTSVIDEPLINKFVESPFIDGLEPPIVPTTVEDTTVPEVTEDKEDIPLEPVMRIRITLSTKDLTKDNNIHIEEEETTLPQKEEKPEAAIVEETDEKLVDDHVSIEITPLSPKMNMRITLSKDQLTKAKEFIDYIILNEVTEELDEDAVKDHKEDVAKDQSVADAGRNKKDQHEIDVEEIIKKELDVCEPASKEEKILNSEGTKKTKEILQTTPVQKRTPVEERNLYKQPAMDKDLKKSTKEKELLKSSQQARKRVSPEEDEVVLEKGFPAPAIEKSRKHSLQKSVRNQPSAVDGEEIQKEHNFAEKVTEKIKFQTDLNMPWNKNKDQLKTVNIQQRVSDEKNEVLNEGDYNEPIAKPGKRKLMYKEDFETGKQNSEEQLRDPVSKKCSAPTEDLSKVNEQIITLKETLSMLGTIRKPGVGIAQTQELPGFDTIPKRDPVISKIIIKFPAKTIEDKEPTKPVIPLLDTLTNVSFLCAQNEYDDNVILCSDCKDKYNNVHMKAKSSCGGDPCGGCKKKDPCTKKSPCKKKNTCGGGSKKKPCEPKGPCGKKDPSKSKSSTCTPKKMGPCDKGSACQKKSSGGPQSTPCPCSGRRRSVTCPKDPCKSAEDKPVCGVPCTRGSKPPKKEMLVSRKKARRQKAQDSCKKKPKKSSSSTCKKCPPKCKPKKQPTCTSVKKGVKKAKHCAPKTAKKKNLCSVGRAAKVTLPCGDQKPKKKKSTKCSSQYTNKAAKCNLKDKKKTVKPSKKKSTCKADKSSYHIRFHREKSQKPEPVVNKHPEFEHTECPPSACHKKKDDGNKLKCSTGKGANVCGGKPKKANKKKVVSKVGKKRNLCKTGSGKKKWITDQHPGKGCFKCAGRNDGSIKVKLYKEDFHSTTIVGPMVQKDAFNDICKNKVCVSRIKDPKSDTLPEQIQCSSQKIKSTTCLTINTDEVMKSVEKKKETACKAIKSLPNMQDRDSTASPKFLQIRDQLQRSETTAFKKPDKQKTTPDRYETHKRKPSRLRGQKKPEDPCEEN